MTRACQVLIVDDDSDLRASLAEAIRDEGFDVVALPDGVAALDHLRSAAPTTCLILLDLMMPVMDGWQFLELQRQDAALAAIPVCVISAVAREQAPPQVACVFSKPLSFDALIDKISEFCSC